MPGHPLPIGSLFVCGKLYDGTCMEERAHVTSSTFYLKKDHSRTYAVFGEMHSCSIIQNVYLNVPYESNFSTQALLGSLAYLRSFHVLEIHLFRFYYSSEVSGQVTWLIARLPTIVYRCW